MWADSCLKTIAHDVFSAQGQPCCLAIRWRSYRNLRCIGYSAIAICTQVPMTVAPQLAMRWRPCACKVRASCDDGHTAPCDALVILRLQCAPKLRWRSHSNLRSCARNVCASCDDGRTATCDVLAILRVYWVVVRAPLHTVHTLHTLHTLHILHTLHTWHTFTHITYITYIMYNICTIYIIYITYLT